jgi:hypothetical protein
LGLSGCDWCGYQDLPLASEYFASDEVYTAKMFERDISEEELSNDRRCDQMFVLTPEYWAARWWNAFWLGGR